MYLIKLYLTPPDFAMDYVSLFVYKMNISAKNAAKMPPFGGIFVN